MQQQREGQLMPSTKGNPIQSHSFTLWNTWGIACSSKSPRALLERELESEGPKLRVENLHADDKGWYRYYVTL